MPRVECPECGETVRVRAGRATARCPECGERCDLPDEDELPPPRHRRRSSSPGLKTAAVVAGAVFVVVVVAAAVVLTVRDRRADPLAADARPDRAKVTADNFRAVKPGMDVGQVERLLGGGRPSSEEDMRGDFRRSVGEIEAALEAGFARAGAGAEWRRWDGDGLTVWVAFARSADGTRAAFSTALDRTGTPGRRLNGFITLGGPNGHDLDRMHAARRREEAVRADPKWTRGAAARGLLAGEWRSDAADLLSFNPDGTLTEFDLLPASADRKPTYRILDDRRVEVTHPAPPAPPPPPPGFPAPPFKFEAVVRTYEYHVNQDELALIEVASNALFGGSGQTLRTFYRMPGRPGGPADAKLIAPLIADVRGTDPGKRQIALSKLRRIGPGAATALPALRALPRGTADRRLREEVEDVIRAVEAKG